jgi:multicomponent Na+:H+ antiporter subunit B
MNTLIFRTLCPLIVTIMLVFSVYICLRGHNEPGGGFVGGLIAAAAMAVLGMSAGPDYVRQALRFDPMSFAGFGVLLAGCSGLLSALAGNPFMTSIWLYVDIGRSTIPFSTPMFFDIGVYFVVFGSITAVALAIERDEGGAS